MIRRRDRRARAAAASAALIVLATVVPAAPASASASGECTDNVGVTVVVDFQALGGGVSVACAPGPVSSGLDAFDRAGVSWEGTKRFPGLVCRIAGRPTPSSDACVNAPPANAYWSYWIAPRGGEWCFSSLGAGNRTPPPGAVEGWSFSADAPGGDAPAPRYAPPGAIPGTAPNPLRGGDCGSPAAPPSTPASTAPALPTGGTSAGAAAPGAGTAAAGPASEAGAPPGGGLADATGGNAPAAGLGTGSDPSAVAPGGAASSSSPGASPAAGATGNGQFALNAVDLTSDGHHHAGTPVGVIATGALIALFAIGAASAARRRRRASSVAGTGTGDPT